MRRVFFSFIRPKINNLVNYTELYFKIISVKGLINKLFWKSCAELYIERMRVRHIE